jgi:hypothetical protein
MDAYELLLDLTLALMGLILYSRLDKHGIDSYSPNAEMSHNVCSETVAGTDVVSVIRKY